MATTPSNGWPDATNTGVPAGVTLTASGDVIIDKPGTVISGLNIRGSVYINADNVTVENCQITSGGWAVVKVKSGVTGAVVQDCTIDGTGHGPDGNGNEGIMGQGTFLRNNISNVENGITIVGNNSVIKDNYIHDLNAGGSPHYDGIQIDGGVSNIEISHNSIINQRGWTSAIMIDNYFGAVSNVTVNNNLLTGGAYTVYSDGTLGSSPISGVSFTNNHIGGGAYGPAMIRNSNPVYTGNIDDGATLAQGLQTTGQPSGGGTTDPTTPEVPHAPAIASFSNDSGVAGDGVTNDNTLTLKGTAAAGSTLKVFDGTTQIGTATADSKGAWSYTTAALAEGKHSLTAKATDASGQTSAASSALGVTIDTKAPNAPTIANDASAAKLAATASDASNGVTLTGTAEANSTVKVFDGTTQIGTATANGQGAWSLATGALAAGSHNFTAKATDAAGNTGTASSVLAVNVDKPTTPSAPDAPKISSFSNDSGVAGDGITNDNTLTLKGTAAANSTVKVFDGTTQIGTATANSNGAWSFTSTALADGKHDLTAKATDASGQTSSASTALGVTIDTKAPDAPLEVSHSVVNGDQLLLKGTAEANSTIKVFDGTTEVGTAKVDGTGNWSLTTPSLANGAHVLTATATDAAGNTSPVSLPFDPVIDKPSTSLTAPKIASISRDTGVVGDGITSDNTLTMKGTAAANSTIKVFDGATQIGTATANAKGAWSFTSKALADGAHDLTAKVADKSGHDSAASDVFAMTVDTHAPNAPKIGSISSDGKVVSDGVAHSGHVTLAGTAEAHSTVKLYDGTTQIGTATANDKGAWTYDAASLKDGSHQFSAKALDLAGNLSAGSKAQGLTIDSHTTGGGSGHHGDGLSTDFTSMFHKWNDTVTFKGTADPYSQISIYDNGKGDALGVTKAGADGKWSLNTKSAVSDAVHNFTAEVTNKAGDTGSSSGSAILGTGGNDVLKSTSGNDLFHGHGGHDTFVFAPNFGADVITDFRASGRSHDVVQFSKSVFDDFADVLAHASQQGHDVVIDAGAGNSLTLKHTKIASLDKMDFHFA